MSQGLVVALDFDRSLPIYIYIYMYIYIFGCGQVNTL